MTEYDNDIMTMTQYDNDINTMTQKSWKYKANNTHKLR